jgi:hypothetical protein
VTNRAPARELPASARYAYLFPALFLFILPITHTVAIRTICLAASLILATYVWIQDRPPAPPRYLLAALALWAGIAALTLIWTIDFDYSVREFRSEVGYALATFFVFYALSRTERDYDLWLMVLSASALLIAAYGILNYVTHDDWYTGAWIGDRNAYSTYAVLIMPMLVAALLREGIGRQWKLVASAATLLTLAAGALTLNRIMWPALFIAGLVAFALLVSRTLSKRGRMVGAGVLAALLVMAPSILLVKNVPVAERGINAAATVLTRIENDPRVAIWVYAGERIAERPLTGYGFGRGILRRDFREHFGNPLHWHGHNMFVNHAIEGGVGLAAALALVGVAFVFAFAGLRSSARQSVQLASVLGIALLTVSLVKTMTDDVLVRETSLLLWAALGATLGCGRHREIIVRRI